MKRGRPKLDTVALNLRIDRQSAELFERTYPELINLFVTRSIKYALESRQFFDDVFFHDLVVNHKV